MKKLFTLVTLALLSIGSAWAQTTLFEYKVAGVPDPMEVKVYDYDATGGTCSFNVTSTSSSDTGSKGVFGTSGTTSIYAFGTGNAYVKVTLNGTETFKKNDIVTITGICTNNKYAERGFTISDSGSKDSNGIKTTFYTAKSTECELTAILGDKYDGANTFYIRRNDAGYFVSIKVERPATDTASPSITTDLSTLPVDVDVNIGTTLSITASHVTGYQWYRNTTASTEGGTAIDGATSASYKYTAPAEDAEKTVYFYCVVTNDNATGTKTATSKIAQVKVGALPTLTAVTNQIWDLSDFSGTYSEATIVNNLEICDGTIDGNNKSIDGFKFTKRIKINKDDKATSKYIKFKVGGPCAITVYGMSGTTGKNGEKIIRVLGVNVDGTEVATLSNDGEAIDKVVYTYTGSAEAEVVLFCKEGSGTFNVHGIVVSDVTATISDYEWSTFVSEKALTFSGLEGIEAYAVTGVDGTTLVTEQIEGAVPANTPLLIKGTAKAKYYIPMAGSNAKAVTANKLVAGTGAAVSAEAGKTRYVLSVAGEKAVFKKIDGVAATVAVGKAYLEISGSSAPQLSIFGGDDDQTTGISGVQAEKAVKGEVYDMQGRRVQNPTKGLYIVGGKKVVVK